MRGPVVGRRTDEARTRAPVNRELAVEHAVDVADREGIEAVTMRRLARELGVEAASLYHYVSGKDEILDGLVERVSAEIDLPARAEGWRPRIRHRAHSTRAVLRRHPWAVALMASR